MQHNRYVPPSVSAIIGIHESNLTPGADSSFRIVLFSTDALWGHGECKVLESLAAPSLCRPATSGSPAESTFTLRGGGCRSCKGR